MAPSVANDVPFERQSIWREKVFRGEYQLFVWSRVTPESPGIGYAPLENQIKQWANESRIEGWFPLLCEEQKCFSKNRRAEKKRTATSKLGLTGKHVASDAGDKTADLQLKGEICLDLLPHRRTNKAPFASP
jgi:hypothetical protein